MKFAVTMRTLASSVAIALAATSGVAIAQKTTLNVYTALETDQLKAYTEGFNKVHPDIELKWTRDSTGVITAKLLAEKANPQADVVFGTSASSLAVFDNEGMLLPYAPKGLDKVSAKYRDPKNPPAWVGMDVYGAAICFNTIEAQKQNLPKPETWADLLKPVYKGKIVMPNPASSGTGYFDVTAWLQMWGDQKAWKYMDDLHQNIAQYTHSGSKPCKQAAAGEFPIGVTFEYRAVSTKKSGAPIDVIFPKEGLGWDLESSGIMKNTKKLDAAKKLMDWMVTPAAMELYGKNFAVLAVPGIAKPLDFVPADYEQRLIKNDFAWSAKNRDKILAEWTKRYDGKSEAK
ncbi:MAG: putative 2-aminoethylphosphonate ABC transporter substrate-binding protein [Burkholderiales bacterium]|nr:putative 2-aminoethylphosphonate ABC transporter substrate-binding protein [Burkholderiales bacterium]